MSRTRSALAPDLAIRPSQLYVKDLAKLTEFYVRDVGLEILHKTPKTIVLGQADTPILRLTSHPELASPSLRDAGLFHNAIVFSSRAKLAETLLRIFKNTPYLYEGSADHLVSEAFYFHDPEFNGLELYFDRPKDQWQWTDGRVHMDTLYLDPHDYIRAHLNTALSREQKLGHVHLKIGDIGRGREFYVDTLGFDITAELGGALFVSVGGYHHHLGMNTWLSKNADKRTPSLGLGEVDIALPHPKDLENLAKRLTENNLKFQDKSGDLIVADPWNNKLRFSAGV